MKKMLMKEIILKNDEHDNNINLDEVDYDNKKNYYFGLYSVYYHFQV